MSDMTVQHFAEVVGIPLDRLLEQLKAAGLAVDSAEAIISEEQKLKLLGHLRKRHGKSDETLVGSPKRVTLRRKSVSTLTQGQATGKAAKTINIEVRKKKTYVKRSEVDDSEALKEHEQAQQALNKQQQEIAKEQQQRTQREADKVAAAEEHRLHLEAQAHEKHEEEKKRQEVAKLKAKQERLQQQQEALKKAEKETQKQELLKQNEQQVQQAAAATVPAQATNAKPPRKQPAQRPETRNNKYAKDNRGSKGFDNKKRRKKGKQAFSPRNNDQDDNKHKFEMPVAPMIKEITIPESIIVSDLAQKLSIKAADIIKQLMKLGMMATINQAIDQETAVILVEELGHKPVMQNDEDFEKDILSNFSP